MSNGQRLRRVDPQRTEPIRNWSTLYQPSESERAEQPSSNSTDDNRAHPIHPADTAHPAGPADSAHTGRGNETVSRGVKLGYEVIEEHLRQGQKVAQMLGDSTSGRKSVEGNIRAMAERIFRYSADLGSLWVDFIDSVVGSPEAVRDLASMFASNEKFENQKFEEAQTNGRESGPVCVEVVSARPARVTLDMRPESAGRRLIVHDLRAAGSEMPPLTGIRFVTGRTDALRTDALRTDALPYFRISVPAQQPVGSYHGLVMDQDSGQVCGTLSVRISPEFEDSENSKNSENSQDSMI